MNYDIARFGFPLWLRLTHYINFLFLTMLIRSGIQILAAHPRLYGNPDCTPGSEWLKFTKKIIPKDRLWTSTDEAADVSPWIALPGGRDSLGMGRHWHFFAVAFWVLNGLVYVACIQGWSGFAEWTGVPLAEILKRCKVLPQARFVIFRSDQLDEQGREYYGTLDLEEAGHPQTILAYEMNGVPLLLNHGAPLRLRAETKLGFKMVKWLKSIELVEDYRTIGEGHGGYREDVQYYGTGAEI